MKNQTTLIVLLLIAVLGMQSCGDLENCTASEKIETTILVDVTDQKLIDQIDHELDYFSAFAKAKQLLRIEECGSSSLSIAPISSEYKLKVLTDSIYLQTQNLTGNDKKRRKNPEPLFSGLEVNYNRIKERVASEPKLMEATDMASVIAKAIIRLANKDRASVIIFSDFVVYNDDFNFYREVPTEDKSQDAFKTMLGNSLHKSLLDAVQIGSIEEVYLVTLTAPTKIAKSRMNEIYEFWETALSDIGLEVVFTDSLNNL